ncbi:MAG: 50S ribosomal protein L3 [Aquificaceae bacterium]|nr:50S ribosomal protein L3 [Aquificaceae bacterium]
MSIGLIAVKAGMTRIFLKDGSSIPVCILKVPENRVVRIKNEERDGYSVVQVSAVNVKEKRLTKAELGHLKKHSVSEAFRVLKEFPINHSLDLQNGKILHVQDVFSQGELVDVIAISKGKGYAGTMKRWGFGGFPSSHGHRYHRAVGSIGNRSDPGRVWRSKRMAGHMGSKTVRVQGLYLVDIIPLENILLVKGSVPGVVGGSVFVVKSTIASRRSQKLKLKRMQFIKENIVKNEDA